MEPIASWRRWLAATAVLIAGAAVFWSFDALPFQDLPAHAGLMALRHRLGESALEQRYFVLSPHLGPYSAFRIAGEALGGVLGPVGAVRLLMTIPIVALPLAVGWARRRLHGDGALGAAAIGLCLAFGFMTLLGFASYLLGIAVFVVAYAFWLEAAVMPDSAAASTPAREGAVAAAAVLLLLVHGYAFAVFLCMAVATAIATGTGSWRLARLRALVPSVALASGMVWLERAGAPPSMSAGMAPGPHFAGILDKLGLLCTPTLMTRWGIDLLVGLFTWALLAAGVVATMRHRSAGMALSAAPRRLLRASLGALGALCIAFFALPRSVGWFGFIDGRLVPIFFIVAVLAIRREALSRWARQGWDHGTVVGAAVLVAVVWLASYRFQSEAAGWREAMRAVPEGSLLLNLPLAPDSDVFVAHPFVHYDKLALVDRRIVVSDVWFHQGTALYPTPENPSLRLPAEYSESNLQRIEWPHYDLADWDYALVRTKPRDLAPVVPPSLALVSHEGGWWLYATARAGRSRR
jgi:hypothetical protein